MTSEDRKYAYQRLYGWACNEEGITTWDLFLALTNNLDGEDLETHPLGYLEGSLLAKALVAWADDPGSLAEFLVSPDEE